MGRSKELIISGGYNVYPIEVENAIEDHDAILEATVYGVNDSDLGEKVMAAVVNKGRLFDQFKGDHCVLQEISGEV